MSSLLMKVSIKQMNETFNISYELIAFQFRHKLFMFHTTIVNTPKIVFGSYWLSSHTNLIIYILMIALRAVEHWPNVGEAPVIAHIIKPMLC